MRIQRTADEPRRPGANAKLFDGLLRRLAKRRMTGQAKVIVRGKVEILPPLNLDAVRLNRVDPPEFAPQTRLPDRLKFVSQMPFESRHQSISTTSR